VEIYPKPEYKPIKPNRAGSLNVVSVGQDTDLSDVSDTVSESTAAPPDQQQLEKCGSRRLAGASRIFSASAGSAGLSGSLCAWMMGKPDQHSASHITMATLGSALFLVLSFVHESDMRDMSEHSRLKSFKKNLKSGMLPALIVAVTYFAQAHDII
jgi:hypothetical protein